MRITAILNPAARNGTAGRRRAKLEAAFRAAGLPVRWAMTEGPGHGAALARAAAQTSDAVIAVGGDGTVHEVGRGLIEGGGSAALGVVPFGTGNDFARALRMPGSARAAIRALAHAEIVAVDYGRVRWREESDVREEVFVNAMGLGFDARAADEGARTKRLPGLSAYLLAVFRALRRRVEPGARLFVGTPEHPGAPLFDGKLLFVTAGNGFSSGGGFRLTPRASLTDGLLEVLVVEAAPTRRILSILPFALWGRHLGFREAHAHRVPAFFAELAVGVPLHADGEVLSRAARRIAVEVAPGGLRVLVPQGTGNAWAVRERGNAS